MLHVGSVTLKEALGDSLAIFTVQRLGGRRNGEVKLQIPMPALDASSVRPCQIQLHIIDIESRSGFELVIAKKKRYLFRTASVEERDQWVHVLRRYAQISSCSASTPGGALMTAPAGFRDKNNIATEQHSLSSLDQEDDCNVATHTPSQKNPFAASEFPFPDTQPQDIKRKKRGAAAEFGGRKSVGIAGPGRRDQ